jgi:hypothetical protein
VKSELQYSASTIQSYYTTDSNIGVFIFSLIVEQKRTTIKDNTKGSSKENKE